MTQKEIEKQNFILWYSLYATAKELKIAQTNNKETLDRLLKEYAEEVDKIDKSKCLYERIIHSRNIKTQGFDVTLKIDCFSRQRKSAVLENV